MISLLKNPIVFGSISGILAVILFYIDSKITQNKKEKKDYIKLFIIISIITGVLIYVINLDNIDINLNNIKKSNIVNNFKSDNTLTSKSPILSNFSKNNDLPDF